MRKIRNTQNTTRYTQVDFIPTDNRIDVLEGEKINGMDLLRPKDKSGMHCKDRRPSILEVDFRAINRGRGS